MQKFRQAYLLQPDSEEVLRYMNILKRFLDGRIDVIALQKGLRKTATKFEGKNLFPPQAKETLSTRLAQINEALDQFTKEKKPKGASKSKIIAQALQTFEREKGGEPIRATTPSLPQPVEKPISEARTLQLDDEVWTTQPNTKLQIEYGKTIIMEGSNIKQFLVLTPGFIEVTRIDEDRIQITARHRGTTILLVWDDRGRWTFSVEVIFQRKRPSFLKEAQPIEFNAPFKLKYMGDWNTLYSDQNEESLKRKALNLTERVTIEGETPYGFLDTSMNYEQTDTDQDITGYTAGLSNAQVGPLKNFSLRGFDFQKAFSPLTLPGKFLRGGMIEGYGFGSHLGYSVLWGRDRSTFSFLSPGAVNERKSFIEGARLSFSPNYHQSYAFNYVRGYGKEREGYLKDKSMSLETNLRFKKMTLESEVAYDTDNFAKTVGTEFHLKNGLKMGLKFRDIESEFVTITGIPSNRGEIGGTLTLDWRPSKFYLDTNLDVYQDRALENPDRPDTFNFDWYTNVGKYISETLRWNSNLAYINDAGLLSPRMNVRVNNNLTKTFRLPTRRTGSLTIGNSYQRSRYSFSPESEFDRYGWNVGFRLPIYNRLTYFLNYEYYWVKAVQAQETYKPNVISSGFGYTRSIGNDKYLNLNVTYRDEEDTNSIFSFLAGEDSVTGTFGISYQPQEDFEFYLDGRVRTVWPEEDSRDDYFEAEVRTGLRMSWDLPFSWNPKGVIRGMVYKDMNGNGKRDPNEEGVEGVVIKVGKLETKTDKDGQYQLSVRGKTAEVSIDFDSIPAGYILTTPVFRKVKIVPHRRLKADFGITTRSGIYGVVFYDANNNGRWDENDKGVPKVKITLDGKKEAFTDFSGAYYFKNISPGEHAVSIDINSIPIQYIPLIKLKTKVKVEEGTTYVLHVPLKLKK